MSLVTVETTSTLETILASAGPLIGVAFGAWGSWRLARSADKKAQRTQIARAFANYIAATELVAVEMSSFPPESRIERQVDRLWPQRRIGFFVNTVLARLAFSDRHYEVRRQYQQARAELVLLAPIEVIALVGNVDDFFLEWSTKRGPEMDRRWLELRDEIRLVGQRTVDEQRGRPYRAGEPPMTRRRRFRHKRVSR
jgi:hypothetical protein